MVTEADAVVDRLWHTEDGGRHWNDATPPGVNPSGITAVNRSGSSLDGSAFVSGAAAWVPVNVAGPSIGNIVEEVDAVYRTLDGGRTWTDAAHVSGGISGLNFLNTSFGVDEVGQGVAAGSSAVRILVTRDRGSTWTEAARANAESSSPGLTLGCDKGQVTLQTVTHWWVPASCNNNLPYLARTLDGGGTWQPVTLPSVSGSPFALVPGQSWVAATPIFFDATHGVEEVDDIPDSSVPALAEVTDDGGETWSPRQLPVGAAGHVDYLTRNDWIAQAAGALLTTHDGGRQWATVATSLCLKGATVEFVSPTTGWAVLAPLVAGSRLFATTNAGQNWYELSVPQSPPR